jgi:hypothetical protein
MQQSPGGDQACRPAHPGVATEAPGIGVEIDRAAAGTSPRRLSNTPTFAPGRLLHDLVSPPKQGLFHRPERPVDDVDRRVAPMVTMVIDG